MHVHWFLNQIVKIGFILLGDNQQLHVVRSEHVKQFRHSGWVELAEVHVCRNDLVAPVSWVESARVRVRVRVPKRDVATQ